MTRLWPAGQPIRVQTGDRDCPEQLTWQGQAHPVEGIANRWLVDEDWWKQRIWREYFKLFTTTGLLLVIYHDLVADRWYVQRLYD
jgi:hypothetical protein